MAVSVSSEILDLPGELKQNIYNIYEINSQFIHNVEQKGAKPNCNSSTQKTLDVSKQSSQISNFQQQRYQQQQGLSGNNIQKSNSQVAASSTLEEQESIDDIEQRVQRNITNMIMQNGQFVEQQEKIFTQLKESIKNKYLTANYNQVNLHFCPEDVYSGQIDIGQFLQLFIYRYDFSMPFNEYLAYFKNLNYVYKNISKITKHVHNESKIFNSKTMEGQKRMQQIKTANMFNQQVNYSFFQLIKCCSGAEYIPDLFFKMKFEKLPEHVQKLIDVALLSTDRQKLLYQIIACGTNDMKLTYNENYTAIVEELEKQMERTSIWAPYGLYLQIIKANKKAPKNQEIIYNRCGYETHLINQLEKVMLYFIMRIVLARKTYSSVYISTNELITMYQKILSMMMQINQMEELKTDDLWMEIDDFVEQRAQQSLSENTEQLAFKYDRYGIFYETGEVFEQSESDAEKQRESIRGKRQKQIDNAEAERLRREAEIEKLVRQK